MPTWKKSGIYRHNLDSFCKANPDWTPIVSQKKLTVDSILLFLNLTRTFEVEQNSSAYAEIGLHFLSVLASFTSLGDDLVAPFIERFPPRSKALSTVSARLSCYFSLSGISAGKLLNLEKSLAERLLKPCKNREEAEENVKMCNQLIALSLPLSKNEVSSLQRVEFQKRLLESRLSSFHAGHISADCFFEETNEIFNTLLQITDLHRGGTQKVAEELYLGGLQLLVLPILNKILRTPSLFGEGLWSTLRITLQIAERANEGYQGKAGELAEILVRIQSYTHLIEDFIRKKIIAAGESESEKKIADDWKETVDILILRYQHLFPSAQMGDGKEKDRKKESPQPKPSSKPSGKKKKK